MARLRGWCCSSSMKETTQKTSALFYLTKLSRCTHSKACSTRTSTSYHLPNILQDCRQNLTQYRSIKTKSHMRLWCRNRSMGYKFRLILTSLWPRPRSRTTSLVIVLALCPTWQPRLPFRTLCQYNYLNPCSSDRKRNRDLRGRQGCVAGAAPAV